MSIRTAAEYARNGWTVAWFTVGHSWLDALDEIAHEVGDDLDRVVRTNGHQQVRAKSGGRVLFFSVTGYRIRGYMIDIAILPDWILIQDPQFMAQLLPAFRADQSPRIGVNV